MYAYCKENDILIHADSFEEAVEYAKDRLSPAYGFEPGRADSLNLRPIRDAGRIADLEESAIFWDIVVRKPQ